MVNNADISLRVSAVDNSVNRDPGTNQGLFIAIKFVFY